MANRFPLLAILRRRHSQSLSTTLPLRIRAQLDLTASSEQKLGPPACSPLWLPAEEIEEISRLDQVHQAGGEAIDGDRAGAAPGG